MYQGASGDLSSEESASLSPASKVLALADKVADEHELLTNGVDRGSSSTVDSEG